MRDYIRLGGILLIICFVVAFLLGYVNSITEPKIAELTEIAKGEATGKVIDGQIEVNSGVAHAPQKDTSVTEIVEYQTDKGRAFAVSASPNGYGGEIKMMIGINEKLEVTGVRIVEMSETAGLGTKANDEKFLDKFKGKETKVDAISGATITSNAVKKGISDAAMEVGGLVE